MRKTYKVNCQYGYSITGEKPPKLDETAEYIIISESKYFEYCVIIKRVDGKKYLGNDTWIVPERNLELVSI